MLPPARRGVPLPTVPYRYETLLDGLSQLIGTLGWQYIQF
jgi:hypothetical protein